MRIARGWLRFHRCLDEPRKTRIFEHKMQDFEKTLHSRWGLATSTIEVRSKRVSGFLKWISKHNVALRNVSVGHIERYLDAQQEAVSELGADSTLEALVAAFAQPMMSALAAGGREPSHGLAR